MRKTKSLNQEKIRYFEKIYKDKNPNKIDWNFGTAGPELAKLVIDGVIKRGSKILDVGCGPGLESIFLARQGMNVTAIDISIEALRFAKKLAKLFDVKIKFINADALNLPFSDNSFDAVNDNFVFHHFEDSVRDLYAQEISRVLKTGGIFILRAFSNKMLPGSGPRRLTGNEIAQTFMPYFEIENLSIFRNFPTIKRPEQLHWLCIFRKK